MTELVRLSQMPVRPRHWYIFAVASLEQLIGGALNTVIGIMIPLILLLGAPRMSSLEQGITGASGLVGIALGSVVAGALMDSLGYLLLFRLCPLVIAAGAFGAFYADQVWSLVLCLFVCGLGVGGGYSLDSGYISELMPSRWESFFVGLAKATSSLGFIGGAAVSYLIISADPAPAVWHDLIIFIGALGVITFLLRIRWYQSPRWYLAKGDDRLAQKAAREFFGPDAEVLPLPKDDAGVAVPWRDMFTGQRLKKVILTGVTWACEGLGVYGFGVFLPVLVMALGLQSGDEAGVAKVLSSVRTTTLINIFIAAGFGIGLAVIHKVNIYRLMGWSFLVCAACLGILLAGYELRWAVWVSFLGFIVFETALNAGPHLVTFIAPSRLYSVQERGAGMGIATMLGKFGAILGVFFMPILLHLWGIAAVLQVSIVVQLIGAAITFVYARQLKLLQ